MDIIKTEHDSDEEGQSCTGGEYDQSDTIHEEHLIPFTFCVVKSEPQDLVEDVDEPESDDAALLSSPLDGNELKIEDALEIEIKSDVEVSDSETEIPSNSTWCEPESKLDGDPLETKSQNKVVVGVNKERPFVCDECNKTFTDLRNLKRHQSIHTDESIYVCNICSKSFKRLRNLNRHERIHTGERPYSCDVCNKSFTQLPHLTRHQRIHTGTQPYTCDICKKSFSQLWNLKMHQYIHTGERPYLCGICKKSFTMPNNLKRHQLKVH